VISQKLPVEMGSLPEPIIGGAKDVALLHSIPGIFPWPWAQAAPICKPENYQPVEMTFSPRFEITPPKIALPPTGGVIYTMVIIPFKSHGFHVV